MKDFVGMIRPETRKYAIGALAQFELSAQSIELPVLTQALLGAGVPPELLTHLRVATAREAFSNACSGVHKKYSSSMSETRRSLRTNYLGEESSDDGAIVGYALNVFEGISRTENKVRQAGTVRLEGELVTFERFEPFDTDFFGSDDVVVLGTVMQGVADAVESDRGKVTRDRLRGFLSAAAQDLGAFRYIGVGNSYFIVNSQYAPGGDSSELTPDNPFEILRNIFEVISGLFDLNSLAYLPIFPDPEDEVLSQTSLARRCAANDARRRLGEAAAKLGKMLVRDKRVTSVGLGNRRAEFDKIKSDLQTYQAVLGLEVEHLSARITEAESLMRQREESALGLSVSVVDTFLDAFDDIETT